MEQAALRRGESASHELMLRLLALLDQVTAAVNDLGFDKSLLVLLAGALNNLNQRAHELQAEGARVTVDELLLKHS